MGGPERGQGRVLVVDDEDVVREATAAVLQASGCEVVQASSASEAHSMVQSGTLQLDGAVIDVSLRDGSGTEIYRALRERDPELPIVMTSAYGEHVAVDTVIGDRRASLLSKPFTIKEVLIALGQA